MKKDKEKWTCMECGKEFTIEKVMDNNGSCPNCKAVGQWRKGGVTNAI